MEVMEVDDDKPPSDVAVTIEHVCSTDVNRDECAKTDSNRDVNSSSEYHVLTDPQIYSAQIENTEHVSEQPSYQLGIITHQVYETQFFGFTPKSFTDGR